MARDGAQRAKKTAQAYGRPLDEQVVYDTYPLTLDPAKTDLWEGYRDLAAWSCFCSTLCPAVRSEMAKG